MKKVGIITFHNALSYGAALQSCATQQFLQKLGIDNEVIDYQCDYINKRYKKIITIDKKNVPKSLVGSLLRAGNKKKSLRLSEKFRKNHMNLSCACTKDSIKTIADNYSFFITGSDQVFSPTCAGFDTTYLLDFAKPEQKYSYSASFGTTTLPDDKKADYKRLLSDFGKISVREQSGAELVKTTTGRTAEVNVDPTLLLTSKDWDKIASEDVQIKSPYILVFSVQKPRRIVDYAIKLGKEKNIPVYYLNDMHFPKKNGLNYLSPVSPSGFVWLIKNAEYVVTNSFHATAFSIIYHKNLVAEYETLGRRNNRSEELLNRLGITDRELAKGWRVNPDSDINWEQVDAILEAERKKSEKYFKEIKADILQK